MIKVNPRIQQTILLNLSLATGVLLLILRGLFLPHSAQYTLLYSLNSLKLNYTTFIDKGFYFLLALIFFLILLMLSFRYALEELSRSKRFKYKAILPFLVNIFTVALLLVIHNIVVLHNFYSHAGERGSIVKMIESGILKPNDSQQMKWLDNINNVLHKIYEFQLPSQYTELSESGTKRGEINIVTNKDNMNKVIVFFTSREQQNYTALLYKLNYSTPIENYLFGVGNIKSDISILEIKQINDNWSWVDVIENKG
ncbi:MAG: hypothetical protein PUP92_00530 [Rhizonema sp. PD38]|nr:hypothetical protein [Rhizonema sp. PD38]